MAEVIKSAGKPIIENLEMISLKVWDEEQSPKHWSRMLVVPLYKKGDKRDPLNYRAVALISKPGKMFHKVLLNEMTDRIKEKTKESRYN